MFIGKMPTSAAGLSRLKTGGRRLNSWVKSGCMAVMELENRLKCAWEVIPVEEGDMVRNEGARVAAKRLFPRVLLEAQLDRLGLGLRADEHGVFLDLEQLDLD